jgi:hypothetical protein
MLVLILTILYSVLTKPPTKSIQLRTVSYLRLDQPVEAKYSTNRLKEGLGADWL